MTRAFLTIDEIRTANRESGHHWFDADTMRFFRSRVSGPVIGNMFVSSENDRLGGGRRYTIRRANDDGSIETVGEFQQYGSKPAALRAIRSMAAWRDQPVPDGHGGMECQHGTPTTEFCESCLEIAIAD